MTFAQAFTYTMAFEGGPKITDDPVDPGGLTKWGISQRAYPQLDIRNLTEDQAKTIYARDYWTPLGCESLTNPVIAAKLFDAGVNMGLKRAAKFAQESLIDAGIIVAVDGHIGPKTIEALNRVNQDGWLLAFTARLAIFYTGLNNPRFLKGWLRRAKSIPNMESI